MKRIKLKSLVLMLIVALTLISGVTIAAKVNLPPIVKPGQNNRPPTDTGGYEQYEKPTKPSCNHNKATKVVDGTCVTEGYTQEYCTKCSKTWDKNVTGKNYSNHVNIIWSTTGTNDNTGYHRKYCTACNTDMVSLTRHQYGSNHSCVCGAEYKWGKEHRFSGVSGKCTAYNCECNAVLRVTFEYNSDLPVKGEYKMIDATENYPHVELDSVSVNFTYPPYISNEDGTGIVGTLPASAVKVHYKTFRHANYNEHLVTGDTLLRNSQEYVLAKGSIEYLLSKTPNIEGGVINDTVITAFNLSAVNSIDNNMMSWERIVW